MVADDPFQPFDAAINFDYGRERRLSAPMRFASLGRLFLPVWTVGLLPIFDPLQEKEEGQKNGQYYSGHA